MKRTLRKAVVLGTFLAVMAMCTGCGDKENGEVAKTNGNFEEPSVQDEKAANTEKTDVAEEETNSAVQTSKLEPPQTEKEMEEAFGIVNEEGKWIPPANSHIDPQTGNIINKDGVVVGTTRKPYSKPLPGSKG